MSAWQTASCVLQGSAAVHTGARHDEQAGTCRWVTEAEFQAAQRMVSCACRMSQTMLCMSHNKQKFCCIIAACAAQAGYIQSLGRQCPCCPNICKFSFVLRVGHTWSLHMLRPCHPEDQYLAWCPGHSRTQWMPSESSPMLDPAEEPGRPQDTLPPGAQIDSFQELRRACQHFATSAESYLSCCPALSIQPHDSLLDKPQNLQMAAES